MISAFTLPNYYILCLLHIYLNYQIYVHYFKNGTILSENMFKARKNII